MGTLACRLKAVLTLGLLSNVARYLVAEAFCSHALVSAADAPTQPVSSMPRNEFVYHWEQRHLMHFSRLHNATLIGFADMFRRLVIGCISTAIICITSFERSYGAAAAFSDDGNHVYLLDSKLPKGMVLDVDLTNFTTKELSLGVSTEVHGIVNAPSALLFVTEKSLYRRPLPNGEVGKVCDAPAGSYFEDVACNRAKHGILLLCHTKDFRDWPAYYLREQESKPTSLVLRRVRALVGAVFDRDGHLFFASGGDLWEGDITTPSEPEEPPAVEADRFAPVALLETANTTPNSTGARELAVAGRTVYAHMTRMGGSGWGDMISVRWPPEPKTEEGKDPSTERAVRVNVEAFQSALAAFRAYGSNSGASYLCGSPDGKKVFFATRDTGPSGNTVRFYLGDETGEIHPLDQLKIENSRPVGTSTQPDYNTAINISISDSSIKVGEIELRTGPLATKGKYISKKAAEKVFGPVADEYSPGRVSVYAWPNLGLQIQEGLRGSEEGKIFKFIAFFENNRREDKNSGEFKGHVVVNGIDVEPNTSFESIRTELTQQGFKVTSSGDTTYARKESPSGHIEIYKSQAGKIEWIEAWCQ